jgi:hypothetical protein
MSKSRSAGIYGKYDLEDGWIDSGYVFSQPKTRANQGQYQNSRTKIIGLWGFMDCQIIGSTRNRSVGYGPGENFWMRWLSVSVT